MKKRIITTIRSAALLLAAWWTVSSCNVLDQEPYSELTKDNFFKTGADASAALNATYDALQGLVEDMFVFGEGRSDLVRDSWGMGCCGRNGQDNLKLWQQVVTPDNGYTSWTPWYNLINRANTVIKNVPGITDVTFLQRNKDETVGQALYLRALAYAYLVRTFGAVPLVTEPSETSSQDYNVTKSTEAEILAQIEADLLEARTKLATYNPGDARNRANRAAVNSLLTEMYLWQNKYTEAYEASVAATTTPPAALALLGTADWTRIFWGKSNNEIIFAVNFNFGQQETNPLQRLTHWSPGDGGSYIYQPSNKAKQAWIDEADVTRGNGASYQGSLTGDARIWKWIGTSPTANIPAFQSDRDWIIHRLADVLLLRAEALNRLDRKQEAIDLVNQVRTRAGIASTPVTASSTTEQIEDAILKERQLELAFEGKRWFDLVRAGRRSRPSLVVDQVLPVVPTSRQADVRNVLTNPGSWFLPVNRNELISNPALEQADYYK